jgi:hypothetical protein
VGAVDDDGEAVMRSRAGVRRSALGGALLGALVVASTAHVGSPNVFYVGKAGAYDVSVIVRPPQVIPGLAEITVRIPAADADGVRRVLVRPVYWRTGSVGSPAGDVATRVDAPEPTYAGKLWLMAGGSYSVYVTVEGTRGTGTASVPVAAVAMARLKLDASLRVVLLVLGFVLFAGLLTIVRAAAGESAVAPSDAVGPAQRRRGRIAFAIALPMLVLAVVGGWKWWVAESDNYSRTLYRPLSVDASVRQLGTERVLTLTVTDSTWLRRQMSPILPDHGKLMHMFLMREPALDVFAHLHPAMRDSATFEARLPPLPSGDYRVYGDVVHESGFERTLVAKVRIPEAGATSRDTADVDDAWRAVVGVAMVGKQAAATLDDGSIITWRADEQPLEAGRTVTLRFAVTDAAGKPVTLEPYLGMPAHSVITRDDGSVFIHLHPMGTVTAAAQEAFALRDRGDTTEKGRLQLGDTAALGSGVVGTAMSMPNVNGEIAFPYEFPKGGRYRMWVQVKRGGRILTGAFDANVAESQTR